MIYLDNSATSAYKPKEVIKAVASSLKNPVNIGRSVSKKAFLYSKKIYNVREIICDFIGGKEPESVIFTNNATMALNLAFKGALKGRKPHVVTTYTEHNSILRQIYTNENIRCSFIPCNKDFTVDIHKIPELIEDDTCLVALNCASNVTGNVIDFKTAYELAKKSKVPVLFDFSQAVGNIPVDLTGCDNCMAAFSGHKSLLGPQGTGVLYVSPDMKLKTVIEGGTGSMSTELSQPEFYPDRFESGTLNTPGILGLGEGVKFIKKITVEEMRCRKLALCSLLHEKLMNMEKIKVYHDGSFNNKVPLLSFNIGDLYSDEVASTLARDYDISVRGGYHCAPFIHKVIGTTEQGAVRVSPGYKNTKKDIEKLVDSIHKIGKI